MSFSSFIGLTSFMTRSSYTSLWIFVYYRTMKDSILSIFELNKSLLLPQKEIYKNIIYSFMALLYSISFDSTINFIYMTAILNSLFYLAILNMHLFIFKNKNQMLIQTLIFFVILKIAYNICHKYVISLLFLCSDLILLQYPINKFRTGVLMNDKNYFDVENILIEIVISLLWLIYSMSNNYICFFFICIINLFCWICMLFGYQIVIGDIGPNNKIYHFLINVFCIKHKFQGKLESNLL